MEDLVIEDPGVVGQLDGKLFEIALDTDVPSGHITKVRNETQKVSGMSTLEALSFFLKDWRMREKAEAKLITFIGILEDLELNDLANLLREKFSNTGAMGNVNEANQNTETAEPAKKTVDMALIQRQQERINEASCQLIMMTEWNPLLKAMLKTKKVLSDIDVVELDSIRIPTEQNERFYQKISNKLYGRPEIYNFN